MPALRSSEKPKSILKSSKDASTPDKKEKAQASVASVEKKVAAPAKGTKRDRLENKVAGPNKQIKQVETKGKSKRAKEVEDEIVEPEIEAIPIEKFTEEDKFAFGSDSESDDEDGSILHGLSDLSDADSSDQDDDGSIGEITKSGVVKLPSSRDDAVVKSRLDVVHKKKKESGRSSTPIVLYFGRVPKSMPEEPLRTYLSQFGDISRLRLSRNRKTGASKHYAFVEFEDEEVGQIVQETMNNYLLEGRLLQVRILPKEKIHPSLWVGANRKWRKVPEARRYRVIHDKPKTTEEKEKVQRKLLKRQEQRRMKIKSQGIDYDFEGYA